MRIRVLCCGIAIAAMAGMTTACADPEKQIDELYARCGGPDLPAKAVDDCLGRVERMQTVHPSARLADLHRQLERKAEPADEKHRGSGEEDVGARQDTNDENYASSESDRGEANYGNNSDRGGLSEGEGDYGYDDVPFEPDYDEVPPREPEQPMDPDE